MIRFENNDNPNRNQNNGVWAYHFSVINFKMMLIITSSK